MAGNNKKGRRKSSEQENATLSRKLSEMGSELDAARKATRVWKESEKQLRKELGKKDVEHQAAISQAIKQLKDVGERFNTEISAKEEESRAVNLDKSNLEATVLQLKDQVQVRSAELEAARKAWDLEKDEHLSQTVAAKKESAEISRGRKMAENAWNAEKENLLSRLAELETNLAFMASEKGSLNQTNRELRAEAESLKAQLNESNDKLAGLQQQMDQDVKQHSVVIQQYKVAENDLKQQNQMLHKEIDSTRCLLETDNQRYQEMVIENGKFKQLVDELNKKIVELQEAHVNVVKEKDEKRREIESLHGEAVEKYKVVEAELFKEKKEHAKTIQSLRGEITSLRSKKSSLSQILNEAARKYEEYTKEEEGLDENFLLQISQEELLSRNSSFNEITESAESWGNQQIYNLKNQNMGVAEEDDSKILDIQSQNSTTAQEEMGGLIDIVSYLDTIEKLKWSNANENKSPSNLNEKPKAKDVNETQGLQENRESTKRLRRKGNSQQWFHFR